MRISLACNESLGVKCQYQCNVHCINQTCDRTDGSCLYGCEDGHQCVDGIYLISMSFRKIFFTNNVCRWSCNKSKVSITLDKRYKWLYITLNTLFFLFGFLDTTTISLSLSHNLHAIVGGTVGASVTVIIGIVLALFVIRYIQIKKS